MIQHPYDDIEAFALGGLEPARERAVLEHADTCPTCAMLVAEAMAGVGALAELETPREPASRSGPRVLARQLPQARRLVPAAWFAAAAAAIAALLLWDVQLRHEAMDVPIGALVHSHFVHHALQGAGGNAKVLQALDGRWVYVVADGLTPRARYDLWEVRRGSAVNVGEFSADAGGRVARYFDQPPGEITAFAVTAAGATPQQDPRALRWP